MNHQQTHREPFAFWLVNQFLEAEDSSEENTQPISNREFYTIFAVIIAVLFLMKFVFALH